MKQFLLHRPFSILIIFALAVAMFFLLGADVFAEGLCDLNTVANVSQADQQQYWDRLALEAAELEDEIHDRIVSFDVSEDGLILLALEGDQIIVLDDQYRQIQHFHFTDSGSYHVQWNGNNILLYRVRSDLLFETTIDGDLVSVKRVRQSATNTRLINEVETRTEIQRNGVTYRAHKESGLTGFFQGYSYNQLCKVLPDGKEETIVQINEGASHKIISVYLPIALFALIPTTIIIGGVIIPRRIRKKHNL